MVQAQVGETNVIWQGTVSLVTTGNVTYVEYTWELKGYLCESVVSTGPVVRNGSNFWYNFDLEREIGPVFCPQFIARMTTTAALGTLAPGIYTLITTSWGLPVATNPFTVPTRCTPTLQPIGFGANGSFNIQLTGVTNVNYVLQCSTNLVNWTSLSANSGWPPLSDPPRSRRVLAITACKFSIRQLSVKSLLRYDSRCFSKRIFSVNSPNGRVGILTLFLFGVPSCFAGRFG